MTVRRPPSRRSRLLAAALASGVALGAAEITLRLTLPPLGDEQDAVHPMAGWAQVDAYAAYRARRGHYLRRSKTVDDDGFLSSPDCPRPKPPGTLRIAFLGGSSTACTVPPVADDETWPALAVRALRERFPDQPIDFVNAALPGYSTFESYGRLWARVRFLEPDVVFVYHGWNELYYFLRTDRMLGWRTDRDGGWSFDRPPRYRVEDTHPIDAWLGFSQLARRTARVVWPTAGGEVGDRNARTTLATTFDAAGPEIFGTNLDLLLAAGEILGCEVHVAKQATLIVPNLAAEQRARCGYELHGFDHDAHVRAFEALFAQIDARVPATRVCDTASALSGEPRWFSDHVHLSTAGNARLAELVADHLAPSIARRGRAAASPR